MYNPCVENRLHRQSSRKGTLVNNLRYNETFIYGSQLIANMHDYHYYGYPERKPEMNMLVSGVRLLCVASGGKDRLAAVSFHFWLRTWTPGRDLWNYVFLGGLAE